MTERTTRTHARLRPAPAQSRSYPTTANRHSPLLRLQSTAGNAAVSSLIAALSVQRDDKPPAAPRELIFIIQKKDKFTADMTDYVKQTLGGNPIAVANIEAICAYVSRLPPGTTFASVKIVSHGQTNIGGVGMTPPGEKDWRYVKPAEVKAYASKPECAGLQKLLAKGGKVEFWGCFLGSVPGANEDWSTLFNAPVRSSFGEMKIGRDFFELSRGKPLRSSDQVPKDKNSQARFRKWLLGRYTMLSTTGEIPRQTSEDEQLKYMKDLFDRSGGVIKSRVLTRTSDKKNLRPGEYHHDQMWKESEVP